MVIPNLITVHQTKITGYVIMYFWEDVRIYTHLQQFIHLARGYSKTMKERKKERLFFFIFKQNWLPRLFHSLLDILVYQWCLNQILYRDY